MIWAEDSSKRWAEKFVLLYSILWISSVIVVVYYKLYELFTAETYVLYGASISVPLFILPFMTGGNADAGKPLQERFWFKSFVWNTIFSLLANHFYTHYFYNLLGCYYTVPVSSWTKVNDIPIVMHLMTISYFSFYHVLATVVLRAIGFWNMPLVFKAAILSVYAYVVAYLEAFTIEAFPHYRYPDRDVMLQYGSAFYGQMFLITFPAFASIDEGPKKHSIGQVAQNALACGMAVFILFDAWRLLIGPIVDTSAGASVPYAQV